MNINNYPPFDPQTVTGFGTAGVNVARLMYKTATGYNLGLSYDPDTQKFTIIGSSSLDTDKVESMFWNRLYQGWRPVLAGRDHMKNHLMRLKLVSESKKSEAITIQKPHRESIPSESCFNKNEEILFIKKF